MCSTKSGFNLLFQIVIGIISIVAVSLQTSAKLPSAKELKFLQKYGYLDAPAANSEALYKHEAVVEAIKIMQRYGAVPVTGIMDNDTRALLMSPRCGVKDIVKPHYHDGLYNRSRSKRYVIATEGWKKRHLTYHLSSWSPKLGSRDKVLTELTRAFKSWSDYSQLVFKHTEDMNADIIANFVTYDHGDGYPFDGPGLTLAHAYFPYDYGELGGDVHFDNEEKWIFGQGDGVDFFTVAVHELGHSLGLGHSTDPESIMFPYYRGYDPYFKLGYDDILAMYELYVLSTFIDEKIITNPTTTTTEKPKSTTDTSTTTVTFDKDKEMEDESITTKDDKKPDNGIPSTTKSQRSTTVLAPPEPPPNPDDIPSICDGSYDLITAIRGELFVFKDKYLWRFRERQRLEPGYPIKIRDMFPFPKSIGRIDAAHEDEHGNILFFSGRQIYIYDGYQFLNKWPKTLTDLEIGQSITKLDASLIWMKNKKTYLFRGERFWRYDSATFKMDSGYPKEMTRWGGVPYPIDAVIQWKDGNTYFFVGDIFYRFNDRQVYVDEGPLLVNDFWFSCSTVSNSITTKVKHEHKKRHHQGKTKPRRRSHT